MIGSTRLRPRARARHAAAVVCLVVSSLAAPAVAVPLLDGFGGPVGYGTSYLPANDDGSTAAIDLTATFPGGLLFFGGPYSTIYVNNNGNVTFAGPVYTFTPSPFPVASQPMIAPYWADVDTRGGGYPSSNGVFWVFLPGQMVVTWHNVGYYGIHDDRKMDFQLIITNALECGPGDFDVEFRYNRCEWTTGDASGGSGGFGGTPAQSGFDAGNGVDFVEIPGSRTAAILDLCTTSNVDEAGIWRFGVRNGEVACPGTGDPCETGLPGVCVAGITQCREAGIECIPVTEASDEVCDGLDNDCNGKTDDGSPCPSPEVCDRGVCLPPCFEFGCRRGEECREDGLCVEVACLDIECPEGQRCVDGVCVGGCEGVVCPRGQQCLSGRCVDVCDVVSCDEEFLCIEGACQRRCPCRRCADDEICGAEGDCIPLGCDLVTCEEGEYCEEGECHDACEGAVGPFGTICEVGDCVPGGMEEPDPVPVSDGGAPPERDDEDSAISAGGADGGTGPGITHDATEFEKATCACRAASRAQGPWLLVLVLGLVAVLGGRRRRRAGR